MRVYRFLSEKYAELAIKEKRLKVSIINDLNDPFEFQAGFYNPTRTLKKQFKDYKDKVSKTYGILSFSKDWRNPILWSHYADSHKGIALGFELPSYKAIEVKYLKERPLFKGDTLKIAPDNFDWEHNQFLKRIVNIKFKSWGYEDEVRSIHLLTKLTYEKPYYFKTFANDLILKEVIIGCRSKYKDEKMIKLLSDNKGVRLIGSRMAYKSYKVVQNKQRIYTIST